MHESQIGLGFASAPSALGSLMLITVHRQLLGLTASLGS
jgi:hypothetical protein